MTSNNRNFGKYDGASIGTAKRLFKLLRHSTKTMKEYSEKYLPEKMVKYTCSELGLINSEVMGTHDAREHFAIYGGSYDVFEIPLKYNSKDKPYLGKYIVLIYSRDAKKWFFTELKVNECMVKYEYDGRGIRHSTKERKTLRAKWKVWALYDVTVNHGCMSFKMVTSKTTEMCKRIHNPSPTCDFDSAWIRRKYGYHLPYNKTL